ncbi:hypothetical protein NEOLEDRAFT_1161830 [Neolentinus lepideus HHB14362 ss-1]|uniref:Zn(2)-C6 fungal-type domain-containing protein n=1 Tax=Neolentinus lepideus HHB14362 ss-1 TaxID=1314782 RepID=A0A165TMT0_9AGAM|nr:hypothetical protein NEOLEDRAFT_1161830 [Neolentinus lepideus HHB14362 ss-1]
MDHNDASDAGHGISRAKHSRAATTGPAALAGTVRARGSPPPGGSGDQGSTEGARPPAKRARKAINCEPCRSSKLKCDRNRPCSSCVLRGTAAQCYPGSDGMAAQGVRGDDPTRRTGVDPYQEFARIRHSLAVLETLIHSDYSRAAAAPPGADSIGCYPATTPTTELVAPFPSIHQPKKEPNDSDQQKRTVPGMLGQGCLYAGPTSVATNLVLSESRQSSEENAEPAALSALPGHDYDSDLLSDLPGVEVIDGLVEYYFEYCNWVYRHVCQMTFISAWTRFKNGSSPDRLILATVCMITAIAVFYLPERHPLLENVVETHEQLGDKFYSVMVMALGRYQAENRTYTLELVELLLIRCHYLTLSKTDCEEIWTVRGELVSIATAMGLHRDPRKWKMSREVAERRRWAFWHIILLERWQAFMFGRPISIASHHFDTQLPSSHEPSLLSNTQSTATYLPNIALFKLAYILGDIMNDAVSLKPVPYENVMAHDAALQRWVDDLPKEMDLDEFSVARSLASRDLGTIKLGVQSVIIKTSYHHIRFTLHRPYASGPSPSGAEPSSSISTVSSPSKSRNTSSIHEQSLEIAVKHARQLILVVGQARPDFQNNTSLAVPGHMNWGPFHVFSAAMFFSFQLINNPEQAGANMFRMNVKQAMETLQLCKGAPVADKALDILQTLAPLSMGEGVVGKGKDDRDKLLGRVLSAVRNLAFPCHDSPSYPYPYGRGGLDSPASGSSGRRRETSNTPDLVPGRSLLTTALDPNLVAGPHPTHPRPTRNSSSVPSSAYPSVSCELSSLAPYTHPPPMPPPHLHSSLISQHQHQTMPSDQQPLHDMSYQTSYSHSPQHSQGMYGTGMPYGQQPGDDMTWGASMGFGQYEWTNFVNVLKQDSGTARGGGDHAGHGHALPPN